MRADLVVSERVDQEATAVLGAVDFHNQPVVRCISLGRNGPHALARHERVVLCLLLAGEFGGEVLKAASGFHFRVSCHGAGLRP